MLPILTVGVQNNLLANSLGDTSSISRAIAHAKRYGPATTFLTVTPDDINNPTSFRISCAKKSNDGFPSVGTTSFADAFCQGTEYVEEGGSVKLPLDYTARFRAAVSDPVAVAVEFRRGRCTVQAVAVRH